jgi:2,3-diketo-5-methylthio-1-phosphopentane phosphatase
MQIFCDFDGTITRQDTTDYILSRLANPAWEAIEAEWEAGHIGSAECMQRQIALIEADRETLDRTLDEVELDPTFPDFVKFCRARAIPMSIVSDGVDYFIHRILARYNLPRLPVVANHLAISGYNGSTKYRLTSPFAGEDCASASGVCKCRMVNTMPETRIYIGDGRSDFCVANKPELVFAKGKLATFCEEQKIPYLAFTNFAEITHALSAPVNPPKRQAPLEAPAPFAFA